MSFIADDFVSYNSSLCLMTVVAYIDFNSEDRLVQAIFADHLENQLGWNSVYALNQESFDPTGTIPVCD